MHSQAGAWERAKVRSIGFLARKRNRMPQKIIQLVYQKAQILMRTYSC